jgi:spermidine synthase
VPVDEAHLAQWSLGVAHLAAWTIGQLPATELGHAWVDPVWLAPGQPPVVADVMRAYRAAAQRDAAAMQEAALAVLAADATDLAPVLREHMLIIAMLGAAAQERYDAVRDIERRLGRSIVPTRDMTQVRIFLLAWSDR